MDVSPRMDRRGFLLLGAGLVAAGTSCSSSTRVPGADQHVPPSASRPDTPGQSTPTRSGGSGDPATHLPPAEAWSPSPGDVSPAVKTTAARVVEALGSWPTGAAGASAAAHRLAALGQDGRLVDQGGPLRAASDAAVLEVVEAQYGGLLPLRASVLVVCRQWRAASDRSVTAGGTTVDVRLTRDQPRWRVTALHPAEPGPPASGLSGLGRRVLAEPNLDLPAAARGDVASGQVHDSVLEAMLRLATQYRIGVSVVRSGHPTYVFGTRTISDHTRGRAFDAWRINGHAVVDPATPRELVTGYMRAAAQAGCYNVGGPYALSDAGGLFFSNATHHDHVHAAFAV